MTTGIPSRWSSSTVGEVATLVRGVTFKKHETSRQPDIGLVPILRAGNVQDGRIRVDKDLIYVPAERVAPEQYLRSGDTLIATSSGSLSVVGKSALVTSDWTGAHGAFMAILRPHPDIQPAYLSYWLQSDYVRRLWRGAAAGTNINNLKKNDLLSTSVPVLPLAEQDRIVAAIEEHFSHLDAAANAARAAGVKAAASRQSILVAALSGRLSTQNKEEEPATMLLDRITGSSSHPEGSLSTEERVSTSRWELPPGWAWAQLQDLTAPEPRAITDGPFGSNLKTAHYTTTGPRVIRLQNIGDGEFKREDAHVSPEHFQSLAAHSVQPGDLIVASLGEQLPRACLVPPWVPPAIVKADCIRVRLHPEVNRSYVNLALQDPRLRRETAADIKGVGRPRLGLRGIRQLTVPLAPRAEQDRIVDAIEEQFVRLDAVGSAVWAVMSKIEVMRRAVLARAFTGRLVSQQPEGESAVPQPNLVRLS